MCSPTSGQLYLGGDIWVHQEPINFWGKHDKIDTLPSIYDNKRYIHTGANGPSKNIHDTYEILLCICIYIYLNIISKDVSIGNCHHSVLETIIVFPIVLLVNAPRISFIKGVETAWKRVARNMGLPDENLEVANEGWTRWDGLGGHYIFSNVHKIYWSTVSFWT